MKLPAVDRRTLLIGGGAGIGLVVAFLAWPRREGSPLRPVSREAVMGPFLKIGVDGQVTLAAPQVETGQGIWTGLAQIAADELGAAWDKMAVEPAPHGPVYANQLIAHEYGVTTRVTAGSSSIRTFEQPLREAAATARMMLCAQAASRWGVDAAECDSLDGYVEHEGKRLSLGELAAEASRRVPPKTPVLRAVGSGKLAGEPLQRLDLPPKSDGSFRFAGDVRLPRMIFASVQMAPPGGRLTGFSRSAAQGQPGLIDLVIHDEWLGALGQTWWAADHALSRAAPRFTGTDAHGIAGQLTAAMASGAADRVFEQGDYESAIEGSRPLAATYSIAPAPHHSLEAPAAVARFTGDRLEIWVGTQIPDLARAAAAKAAGMAEDKVALYNMPVGDGSGGAMDLRVIAMAVELARHARRPVSLSLAPNVAQNQDQVRPPLQAKMAALPASDGTIRAWSGRLVGMAGLAASLDRAEAKPASKFAPQDSAPPYGIADIRMSAVTADLPIRTGYMRGGDDAAITFATESFIDELARALHAEPLAFRIGMLGGSPRLARTISAAAAIGHWDGGGPGSSMGLACASLYGSHVGLLADATIGADQTIKVSRLVAAVDAGRIVNPNLVRQQIEGGLLAALAAATMPAPEFVAGMSRAVPMRAGYERLRDTPRIEIEIMPSDAAPGGISGLGMAVLAPAVANAIAAGTGRRLRNLPFDPMAA